MKNSNKQFNPRRKLEATRHACISLVSSSGEDFYLL